MVPDRRSNGEVRYYEVGSEDMPTSGYAQVSRPVTQENALVRQQEVLEAFCAGKGLAARSDRRSRLRTELPSFEEELAQDVIEIITVQRSPLWQAQSKTKRLLSELKDEEASTEEPSTITKSMMMLWVIC